MTQLNSFKTLLDLHNNRLNYEHITNIITIERAQYFTSYLSDIYTDLSARFPTKANYGNTKTPIPSEMTKITFMEYFNIQYFICEKVFNIFDINKKNEISKQDFINGMKRLYLGKYEDHCSFIFNMYDFNNDGFIQPNDVKLLLSYIPRKFNDYKEQIKNFNKIDEIIRELFTVNKEQLSLQEYLTISKSNNNETFLKLLNYLYINKPFSNDAVNSYKFLRKKAFGPINMISPSIRTINLPEIKKSYINVAKPEKYVKDLKKSITNKRSENEKVKVTSLFMNNPIKSKFSNKNTLSPISLTTKTLNNLPRRKTSSTKNILSNSRNLQSLMIPSNKLLERNSSGKKLYLLSPPNTKYTQLSPPVNFNKKEDDDNDDVSNFMLCEEDEENKKENEFEFREVSKENWVYICEDSMLGRFNKYYPVLYGSDIIFFSSWTKSDICFIKTLKGTYIKKDNKLTSNTITYYPIKILFSNRKSYSLYFDNQNKRNSWYNQIKEQIGYVDFKDEYKLTEVLGEGKFAIVKKGINIKTGEEVAVKIVDKSKLKWKDYQLIINENYILKLLKHKNIVSLKDYYEDDEYMWIVMEYLSGGDLIDYYEKYKQKLTEKTIAIIIKQIALGVRYMNNFGIVHRDIKMDNIVLQKKDDINSIKIIDFGVAKTIANEEIVTEGVGTVTYIAPEVFKQVQYNKKVDVWSIGIILHFLLSGIFPFDDESFNDDIIGKKVVYYTPGYSEEFFKGRSKACIDLIDKCLEKNPKNRISVEELLKDPWIKIQTS